MYYYDEKWCQASVTVSESEFCMMRARWNPSTHSASYPQVDCVDDIDCRSSAAPARTRTHAHTHTHTRDHHSVGGPPVLRSSNEPGTGVEPKFHDSSFLVPSLWYRRRHSSDLLRTPSRGCHEDATRNTAVVEFQLQGGHFFTPAHAVWNPLSIRALAPCSHRRYFL